ncbi:hypothetical protein [Anaerophaga thermohalophila]|uniref:hypothetical protein n=1 Tax=Anaerophaga thermohalophila TaxID=177400 RepID=UPI00035D062F|nr:hypothetical protein [Anaerophaga thermohalophila]
MKNGLLEKELAKLFSHLFDWRQETDYADFIEFDEDTVRPLLTSVRELNKRLDELIENAR